MLNENNRRIPMVKCFLYFSTNSYKNYKHLFRQFRNAKLRDYTFKKKKNIFKTPSA